MGQIDILKKTSLFKCLTSIEIENILNTYKTEVSKYLKDETIIHADSKISKLGIILKGRCIVGKTNMSGRVSSFSYLGVSEMFGMACLFSSNIFDNSIKAVEETEILYIEEKELKKIMEKYPKVSFAYIELLTNKINFLSTRIDTYLSDDKSDGLFDYLLDLSKKLKSKRIELDISFSKLANMLHMSRSSLYRSLDDLTAKGLIKKENNVIEIL